MNERLCVVMPVYNEQDAIGPVLEKWTKALDALQVDYTIRPYNDGSKDNTLAVMKSVAAHLPHVEVRDKPNGGHGNTILTGYREAVLDCFDWIFQVDSDDEMGPEKFEEIWNKRNDYDFLVGIRDGRRQALPRKIISLVSRFCVKIFYGRDTIWDVNTPYRLMRTSAFKDIYEQIPLTTFAPNVIISGMVARNQLRYFEIRVPQHDRTTGEVSIKKWKLLKAAAKSFGQTIMHSLLPMTWRSIAALCGLMGISMWFFASNPFADMLPTDSAVFWYVGEAMHHGAVPYREVFDHKGPLLYVINYFASFVSPSLVLLWLFECLNWFATVLVILKFMRHCFPRTNPFLVIMTVTAYFFGFIIGGAGNLTETWAVPFMLYPILKISEAQLKARMVSFADSFWIGISVMATLLLRPNLASVSVILLVYWFSEILRQDGVRQFMCKTGFACLGGFMLALPIIVWLVYKEALFDMWHCYVEFNVSYLGERGRWNNEVFFYLPILVIYIVGVFREKGRFRFVLLYALLNFLIALGIVLLRPGFRHYYLALLPASIVAIAYFFAVLIKQSRFRVVIPGVIALISVIVLGITLLSSNFDLKGYVKALHGNYSSVSLFDFCESNYNKVFDPFRKQIDDNNSVLVIGNCCIAYRALGVRTSFRYPYQRPIRMISKEINDTLRKYIINRKSKYLIVGQGDNDLMQIINSGYVSCSEAGGFTLYKSR